MGCICTIDGNPVAITAQTKHEKKGVELGKLFATKYAGNKMIEITKKHEIVNQYQDIISVFVTTFLIARGRVVLTEDFISQIEMSIYDFKQVTNRDIFGVDFKRLSHSQQFAFLAQTRSDLKLWRQEIQQTVKNKAAIFTQAFQSRVMLKFIKTKWNLDDTFDIPSDLLMIIRKYVSCEPEYPGDHVVIPSSTNDLQDEKNELFESKAERLQHEIIVSECKREYLFWKFFWTTIEFNTNNKSKVMTPEYWEPKN